ncbi:MAG: hypothetical protein JWR38_1698 [Mucilaginibacter sp.]|nr:hypothetical protein [Mucilaginibacter sp.]
MKKFSLLIVALIVAHIAAAQIVNPKIGVGSVLNYNVVATSTGQQIPLTLNIISLNDPMKRSGP